MRNLDEVLTEKKDALATKRLHVQMLVNQIDALEKARAILLQPENGEGVVDVEKLIKDAKGTSAPAASYAANPAKPWP
jgi:hypothetical protein